ncbi:hypothetical protein HY839_04615 [Candidatus Azambacteria bacterium]|nr:hypothetical protein [Candidatus Azambacteria bacterium]
MTRSNKVMNENRQNPKGYGHSAPDTASLLLEVVKLLLRRRSLSQRGMDTYRG